MVEWAKIQSSKLILDPDGGCIDGLPCAGRVRHADGTDAGGWIIGGEKGGYDDIYGLIVIDIGKSWVED